MSVSYLFRTISDYFPQPCAVNAINSGREPGCGHVNASDGISHRFHHICRHWAPAYAFRHLFLVDLVPAVALASYDASLSHPIYELNAWWTN